MENKKYAKTLEESSKREHLFWSTQPVTQMKEIVSVDKPLQIQDCEQEIYLQKDFEWFNPDLTQDEELTKISNFLNTHYSTSLTYKTEYSNALLKHFLVTPIYNPSLYLSFGVRVKSNKVIVAFISGTINNMQVGKYTEVFLDVNFLCIYPKLRNKNFATTIMKELKRRAWNQGYKYGIFTTDHYLLKPITTIKYFNRPLNLKKLIEIQYVQPSKEADVNEIIESFELPESCVPEFVEMKEEHLSTALEKLNKYLTRYNIHTVFDAQEFKHMFYNNDVVKSYVLLKNNEVSDFISYYLIKKNLANNTSISTAFLYYYSSTVETPFKLIKNAMINAKNNGIDVFNATNVLENSSCIYDLKFEENGVNLHYYLYNWKMKPLMPEQIGKLFLL